MHASSLENMQKCYERYLGRSPILKRNPLKVFDIGGANINGSYADIFAAPKFQYRTVDTSAGEGVDIVLDDPYVLPFDDASADILLSGQCFEHAGFFWLAFAEMARVIKPDGLIFVTVPSAGPIHRYPVDCYRFYPDAMAALARYADIPMVDCWLDDRGPWNDLTAVYCRQYEPDDDMRRLLPWNRYPIVGQKNPSERTPEVERISGSEPYLQTLARVHAALAPRGYLEIGVSKGDSIRLAQCPAVGVDPSPALTGELAAHHRIYATPSDDFFEEQADDALSGMPLDLAFIDGMHLFEFALRDFIQVERRATAASVIIIDDIFPNHVRQADRARSTNYWTGDIWKLHQCLKTHRPDLVMLPLDTEPTGLLLVTGLNPADRTLSDRYNPIVTNFRDRPLRPDNKALLERHGAFDPRDPRIEAFLRHLQVVRDQPGANDASTMRMIRFLRQELGQPG